MALTKRSGKGSSLTYAEMDANFTHLGGDGSYQFPATDGTANYVLATDGSGQLSFVPDVGLTTLNDLTDTTITSVANDEFLKYNGTAWINSSVAFSDLTTKPTTISGYGITDALALGTTSTTALAGDTALLQLGTTSTTALAGDTALLQLGTTSTTALAGDTSLLAIGTTSTTALAGDTSLLAIGTSATTAMAGNTALSAIGGSLDLSSQVTGTLPVGNMAATALTTIQTASTQAAQLALTTEEGDVVVRTDENKTYMRNGGTADPHDMTDFTLLATPTDAVTSVDGNTGAVTTLQIGTSATTALAGNTALLQLGTSSTTALAGDTALLALGTTSTTALAGDTAIPDVSNFITASSSDTLTNKSIVATQLTGTIDNARLPSAATSITSVGTLSNLIIQPPSGSTGGILVHSRGGNASFLLGGVGSVGDANYVADGIFYVTDAASATIISDSNTIVGPTAVNGALTVNNNSFEVVSTDDDADSDPTLSLYRNRASAADGDDIGKIKFYGNNDAGTPEKIEYAGIYAEIDDMTDGTEDGELNFYAMAGGVMEDPVMRLDKGGLELLANNDLVFGINSLISFQGDTADSTNKTTLYVTDPTAARAVLLPDASGTLALTTELLSLGTTSTTALAGDTALLQLGTTSTTALAGDTALLQLGTTSTTALAGDTTFAFADITSKPTTISGYGITDALALGTSSTTALAGDTTFAFADITSKPTTISGYGITDALQLGTSSTTALAGDTTFAFADITSKPTTIAGYGITDALQLGTTSTTAMAGNTTFDRITEGDTSIVINDTGTPPTADNNIVVTVAGSEDARFDYTGTQIAPLGSRTLTLGSATGTGTITLGQSTAAQTINIAGGSTAGGTTNTVNIASTGGTGSTQTVNIARLSATGVTTNVLMGNTSSSATSNITLTGNTTITNSGSSNTITIGGTTQTGAITLGRSTQTQTINIGTGTVASSRTKTINIGTGNSSGSTTNINIGPSNESATRAIDINGSLTVDGPSQFDHMMTLKSDASTGGVYDQLVSFQAKGTNTNWYEAARIATLGSGGAPSRMIIGQDDAALTFFDGFGSKYVYPANGDTGAGTNGVCDLGSYGARFKLGRFSSGTTTSSDRNEKRDIEELTAAELRVAVRCKPLLRKYRRIDAYEEKGEAARIHFGIIAQDLDDAFTAEGLDAHRYAMFMEDTWYEYEGGVVTYPTLEDIPEEHRASATEHTAMGVRYEQLLAFMIAAL